MLPGALAALGQDPRTHRGHVDVVIAEILAAVAIALSIVLLELRRRYLL